MSHRSGDELRHDILGEIDYLSGLVLTGAIERYPLDPTTKRAVERSVEIIGEAVRVLRDDYPEQAASISSRAKIVAMRHILAHDYAEVRPAVVSAVVSDHLPVLRAEALSFDFGEAD